MSRLLLVAFAVSLGQVSILGAIWVAVTALGWVWPVVTILAVAIMAMADLVIPVPSRRIPR